MTLVYLSLGSNMNRERHINAGVREIHDLFGYLRLSSVYESRAVGFNGGDFLNLVAEIETEFELDVLARILRDIEYKHGRPKKKKVFGNRNLDIDILSYGNSIGVSCGIDLPRREITVNAHVLAPLAEISPQTEHLVLKKSYRELWDNFDKTCQKISIVNFKWEKTACPH